MTEPMSADRVFELLMETKRLGLSDLDTAGFIAEASEDGGAGPKPEDYLSIHLNRTGEVDIALNTHYVNHGGVWVPTNTNAHVTKKLPSPPSSQFVCVDLSELNLEKAPEW